MHLQKILAIQRRRVPLLSIVDSFCKSASDGNECNNITQKSRFFRSVTTSTGYNPLENGMQPSTNSVQRQIIDVLRLGDRGKASSLLLDLSHRNFLPMKADDFLEILQCCAALPDALFAMEIWKFMLDKDISPNETCHLLMTRALCNGGYLEEATNMINMIGESHGIYDSLPMYNSLLRACLKMQSIDHANQCLDLMEQRMVGKDEVTYLELLKLARQQKNLCAVSEIWKDYVKHYSPTLVSLQDFIWSFARLGDLKSAYELLQHMVASAICGNISIRRTQKGWSHSSRLDIPVPANDELGLKKFDFKESEQLIASEANFCPSNAKQIINLHIGNREVENVGTMGLPKLPSKPAMEFLLKSFSILLQGCAQTKNCELAEQLMFQLKKVGLPPSSYAYDGFLRAIVAKRGFRAGMEVLCTMRQKNLKPHNSTLAALSLSCTRAVELDLAESLLDEISYCPYPFPFNAFLDACNKVDKPERAVRMLAKMKDLKVLPNERTYELMFLLFGSTNSPYEKATESSNIDTAKRIKAIEMDMKRNGIQHTHLSMKHMLQVLGAEMMRKEMLQYLRKVEDIFCNIKPYLQQDIYLGTSIYNKVLHKLVEARKCRLAFRIFNQMKSKDIRPNTVTYNVMIECCITAKSYKSAFALLSTMMRVGCHPTTVTYTSLMKIMLKYGNIYLILNILDHAKREGIQLDAMLYNNILHKARAKRRIDIIELLVEKMHREHIPPDPTTCRLVFLTYAKHRFYSMAMEALQVMSTRMLCQSDSSLVEKKSLLEDNYILSEDPNTELQILELFKDHAHTAFALLNLRRCAILGYPTPWSPNESPWARRLSIDYDAKRAMILEPFQSSSKEGRKLRQTKWENVEFSADG
uniref:Pentatricopeptide repeat-containing protein At1g76280 isoform X1 n=2 Tax=Rhizophora mucronata TaxID=61149 RepID=A0A2P2JBY2_RHIMU